ncbi:MAG: tRNA pseudouridine(38-40) synthase TruA [Victivallaceae bacterium]|nr:tRNA pseudouridine(38-40) synthase TruA [Victivallaceae bacterium]
MTSLKKNIDEADKRLLLEISFDGLSYGGWQIQPDNLTVQELIQDTLVKLYAGQEIKLVGSSRTDAGVHAIAFAASFVAPAKPDIPLDKLKKALNGLLPSSIAIRNITEVPMDFHVRFDAVGKAYTYVINLGDETPFSAYYSWRARWKLDVDKMREASRHLIGTHDFSSFVVNREDIENAVRTIYDIDFQLFGSYLCITFVGNGFLYKMIRCLIGALEAAGAGAVSVAAVKKILEAKNRSKAPQTCPPHGLFLMKVFYDEAEIKKFKLKDVPFFLGSKC